MNLDIETGIELITKAYEERANDLLMQRWMLHYQNEISFGEFKNKLGAVKVNNNKTEEEILGDVKNIIDNFNRGVNDKVGNEEV